MYSQESAHSCGKSEVSFPWNNLPMYLETESPWDLELTNLNRLDLGESPGSSCVCLPGAGITVQNKTPLRRTLQGRVKAKQKDRTERKTASLLDLSGL